MSLSRRLILSYLLLAALMVPAVGGALSYGFRESAQASFDQRLRSLHQVLMAALERSQDGEWSVESRLGESLFHQVYSGWYWQISDGGQIVEISRSLWDQRLSVSDSPTLVLRDVTGPRGERLRLVERSLRLPGRDRPLHVALAVSDAELRAQVARFNRLLWLSLLALCVLLLGGLMLQVRWGLSPLRALHRNITAVRAGRARRLDTRLPAELADLASAMNDVLDHDRRLIERGRAAAGNLAHALKTPVSVLQTEAERFPEAQRSQVREEVERINAAVRHHLARASAAGSPLLAGPVPVAPILAPILQGLHRLSLRRGTTLAYQLPPDLQVRVDPQDLQELVGNLLENALEWASARVEVAFSERAGQFHLAIDDDGPGLTAQQREAALARGGRLDERRPGHGLGLAIVQDLVDLYGGGLALGVSPLGGLSVRLWLPRGC
ncbi:sensor histidine kinase [Parahaliea mediterranea]|uniref:sensor histidine kinase n=1 Tax=Parahaliea mediterranea TaxID=651086 RepID=UPI0019D44B51|nr:sensor histidine kinase [Parahaliea mediterranea]